MDLPVPVSISQRDAQNKIVGGTACHAHLYSLGHVWLVLPILSFGSRPDYMYETFVHKTKTKLDAVADADADTDAGAMPHSPWQSFAGRKKCSIWPR